MSLRIKILNKILELEPVDINVLSIEMEETSVYSTKDIMFEIYDLILENVVVFTSDRRLVVNNE